MYLHNAIQSSHCGDHVLFDTPLVNNSA
jgi:hypothetical protein